MKSIYTYIPLKRLRKSILGNSGPGTDSIPVEPDSNPALAAITHSLNINSILIFIACFHTRKERIYKKNYLFSRKVKI